MSSLAVAGLVALGAACGGMLRLLLSMRWDRHAHAGTLGANTLGSLVIGLAAGADAGEAWWALLAIGFCGALTTWSSMAVQSVEAGWRGGSALALATFGLAVGGAGLGYWLMA